MLLSKRTALLLLDFTTMQITAAENSYRKYPNLVRSQVEIISEPNYLVLTSYFLGNLEEEKVLELR